MALCGHRKSGYAAGVWDRFLANYPAIYRCILLRMRRSFDNRGGTYREAQTLADDFSNVALVVFVLVVAAPFSNIGSRVALRTQDPTDTPWERYRALDRGCNDFAQVANKTLPTLRVWLRVLVLVSPYVLVLRDGPPGDFCFFHPPPPPVGFPSGASEQSWAGGGVGVGGEIWTDFHF